MKSLPSELHAQVLNIAHELRNPLQAMRHVVTRLGRQEIPETCHEPLETLHRQINHLQRLVDDLEHLREPSPARQRRPAALKPIVESAIAMCRPFFEDKQQTLQLQFLEADPLVHADEARLLQVLFNLLHNASKFTPIHGRVVLSISTPPSHVEIRLADTGRGIAAHELPHLFARHHQLKPEQDQALGGRGLGLAIVRELIEEQGGSVTVHSDGVDRGTEFVLTLPRITTDGPARPLNILIVDDHEDAAASLCELLEAFGHFVEQAASGARALELFKRHAFEVVLIDLELPDFKGEFMAEKMRDLRPQGDFYCLAASGRSASSSAGFDGHLRKPFDLEALQIHLGHAARTIRRI